MKLKPWMVSVLCLIIALPLVANSAFSAPITTADLIDPHRVDADCANYDEQNGTHGGGQGEEVDEGFTLECRDRVHRVDNKLHGGLNIVGHMVGGSLLMLSAPITFNSNVLRNRKRLHRAAGYTFIVGGVIVGVAAILMTVIFPHRFYPFTRFCQPALEWVVARCSRSGAQGGRSKEVQGASRLDDSRLRRCCRPCFSSMVLLPPTDHWRLWHFLGCCHRW